MILNIICGLLIAILIALVIFLYKAYNHTLKKLATSLAGLIVLHRTLKLTVERLDDQDKLIQNYDNWVGARRDDVNKMIETLNSIEHKELFIADDEIGVIFTDIANVIKSFESKVVDSKEKSTETPSENDNN